MSGQHLSASASGGVGGVVSAADDEVTVGGVVEEELALRSASAADGVEVEGADVLLKK